MSIVDCSTNKNYNISKKVYWITLIIYETNIISSPHYLLCSIKEKLNDQKRMFLSWMIKFFFFCYDVYGMILL